MYLRMSRDVFPDIYCSGEAFQDGKGNVIRDGSDITVVACGLMVGNAMTAAETLAKEGISVRVVDMFCIKPLDRDLVEKCAMETGAIVSAEEHNIYGGLGGAVAEALCEAGIQPPMGFVGMHDCHAECGPYHSLQAKYGLDATAIVAKIRETLQRK